MKWRRKKPDFETMLVEMDDPRMQGVSWCPRVTAAAPGVQGSVIIQTQRRPVTDDLPLEIMLELAEQAESFVRAIRQWIYEEKRGRL